MKILLPAVLTAWLAVSLNAQTPVAGAASDPKVSDAGKTTVSILERGLNHRMLQGVTTEVGENGKAVLRTNTVIELKTGMHYIQDEKYYESSPAIEPDNTNGGAVAARGQHRVHFGLNLAEKGGAIELVTPEGERLRSSPMGIAYFDAASGQSVLIAEITNCAGVIMPPNQVIYRNCLSGDVSGSVRMTTTISSFEQDVILDTQPPTPEEYGLSSSTTVLEVWTEFYGETMPQKGRPIPLGQTKLDGRINPTNFPTMTGQNPPSDKQVVAGPVGDETLYAGSMVFGRGSAFKAGSESDKQAQIPVKKIFTTIDGRNMLIEKASYPSSKPILDTLPKPAPSLDGGNGKSRQASIGRVLPPVRLAIAEIKPLQMAQGPKEMGSGLVLDYIIDLTSATNFVFSGTSTYYVTGPVNLWGTTVLEGGTVIKFTNSVYNPIVLNGPLICETTAWRPAIFTSQDDASVGELVPNAGTTPTQVFIGPALALNEAGEFGNLYENGMNRLAHVRIAYASTGLQVICGFGNTLSHAQFLHCVHGVLLNDGADYSVRNVLINDVTNAFNAYYCTVRAEHLTVNRAVNLTASSYDTLLLTNSLLVEVGTTNSYDGVGIGVAASGGDVFQSVGDGGHYLAVNSPYRNAGTTNINEALASELKHLTTYPPVICSNDFTDSTILWPQAQRDTDLPDLGYHYDPLDYLWCNLTLTNATLVLTNGVTVGVLGSYGLRLKSGASLVSEGTPLNLNRFVPYRAVQEQTAYYTGNPSIQSLWRVMDTCSVLPEIRLRFTDLPMLANNSNRRCYLMYGSVPTVSQFAATDCQFRGGYGYFCGVSESRLCTLAFTNNLLERVDFTFLQGYMGNDLSPQSLFLRNNLLRYSTVSLQNNTGIAAWEVYDNLFDNTSLSYAGTIDNGYNGYLNTATLSGGSGNVMLTVFWYDVGPFGDYYQYSQNLVNAGSRTAAAAGLYHYTTGINEVKEGSSQVDIGLHYVACGPAYDAVRSFSTEMNGYNNWFYGYTTNGQGFTLLPTVITNFAAWGGSPDYSCLVGGYWQHPGETITDSVRRFEMPLSGTVRVRNQVANGTGYFVDGVLIRVRRDSQNVVDWVWLPPGSTLRPLDFDLQVQAGDTLDFQVNRNVNTNYDTTYWPPLITYLDLADIDGDGLPDYLEDRNGNGAVDTDAGETDWQSYNSANGLNGSTALEVFTPMK